MCDELRVDPLTDPGYHAGLTVLHGCGSALIVYLEESMRYHRRCAALGNCCMIMIHTRFRDRSSFGVNCGVITMVQMGMGGGLVEQA